jgi:hypothetical protein
VRSGEHPKISLAAWLTDMKIARSMMSPDEQSKAIGHHTAVLMYHDTGKDTFAADARLFAERWEVLVPEKGQATSIQGEVLRAVGRLATEDRRNGCINWDQFYELLVEFLHTRLPNHEIFNAKRCARILRDLEAVVVNGRNGLAAEEIRVVFGRLIEDAVAYCQALPELVPNETIAKKTGSA